MTVEEAFENLGISLDQEELDIDEIEEKYFAKLSQCGNNAEKKAQLEEACNILIDLYDELYSDNDEKKHNESLMMKFALLMAGMFLLSFSGVMYFVYKIHTESKLPQNNVASVVSLAEYEQLKRELDAIRIKQAEMPAPQVIVNNAPTDYTAIVERAMPSMVFIQTNRSKGSGFFVSSNGDILTNHHVINGAEYIDVTMQNGQTERALIKDYDAQRDMALLKVNVAYAVSFLTIRNKLPKQGEAVIAIGNPRGYVDTVSNGIVSAIREFNNNLWVQFTAPISPGSSGGALFNVQGEVVGMPSLIRNDAQNMNFAVAPTVLTQFLRSAINKPARALRSSEKHQTVSRPQSSNSSGIPLPNKNGFLVHKWGCRVESIERYVSSPLRIVGQDGTTYTTGKSFKAFRGKIDTVVYYHCPYGKLGTIVFSIDDSRSKVSLCDLIVRELTELYGTLPLSEYADGTAVRLWYQRGLSVALLYNGEHDSLIVVFEPLG